MKKHYRKENDCLNCGTLLEGKFCHNCGQENLEMKESFGHMLNHAVSDYFHFDYQFFHTLRPLFLKPGHLTNEYLLGRRAQYLHPVKMYIFISLVFFVFVFQGNKSENKKVKNNRQSAQKGIDNAKNAIDKGIYANTNLTAQQKKVLSEKIKAFVPDTLAKEINADMKKDSSKLKVRQTDDEDGFTIYGDDKLDKFKTHEEYVANQAKLPADKRDNWLEAYIAKKNYDWKSQGKNGKEVLIEGLKHNAPKMMFLLLPLFAVILKLAFWKNHKYYVEHIIYTIHLHCYLFLFLTLIMLLNLILPESWDTFIDWVKFFAIITIIWYIYRSLRVVYNRSRWRTVSKMVGVSIMYTIVFTVSFITILIITAITAA
ncbi:DUF3667 domain-containing protein [Mucilaginibacter sp.]|jgi:hypothetical protein|uniref:DUF3667 domain-containing protein n=1 Tax=Mucilaginibacter sp. TaxID=1882438 RepID=UPI00261D0683|nr:DUF3667 domain-containing protein [Mucilaginibacter sp.]MDB5126086.1 hypothetical protein [Mucilaginibacter sp.]